MISEIILGLLLAATVILHIKHHSLAFPLAGMLAILAVVRVVWVLFFRGQGIEPPLRQALPEHGLIGNALAEKISRNVGSGRILMLRGPDTAVSKARIRGFRTGWSGEKPKIREMEVPLQEGRISWTWSEMLDESGWQDSEVLISWVGLPAPPEVVIDGPPRIFSYSLDPEWTWRAWRGRADFGGVMIPEPSQNETDSIHPGYRWIR